MPEESEKGFEVYCTMIVVATKSLCDFQLFPDIPTPKLIPHRTLKGTHKRYYYIYDKPLGTYYY